MRVKIYLHGHLKEKVGKEFVETEAKTAYESLSMLANTYRKELKAPLDVGRWKVVVRNYETSDKLMSPIRHNVIHVYPIFRTAKSAWVTIVVGALLVAAVLLTGGVGAMGMAAMFSSVGGFVTGFIGYIGVSMIMVGIQDMMYKAPKINTSMDISNSPYLGGSQKNTVDIGTRIPFGYGVQKIAGHFISYNVSTTKIRVIPLGGNDES